MDRTKILEVLHECHALARVDAPTREALVSACTVQPVAADEELIEWGPPPREFFMVADGEVVLTRAVRGGAAPSNRVLRRGALFGGAAVAGLPARLMSARTLCPSTVLRLPGEALHPLVAASRSLAEAIHDLATLRDHEREIVAALKRSSLAGAVNMRRLRDRLDEAVVERFPAGATIVTQGAPAFGAFYLLRGALEAVRHEGGAAVVVDTVHAGEILCDLALSRHVPEPLELRARDAVEVVRIPSLQRSRGRASVSAAAPRASAVDLRAVVGPAGVAPGPFGELLVEQLREAYRDAASLVRVRFDGAAKAAAPDDAPVLEVSLPADGRAGEAFGEFLARHATTTALAVLDTTGLTDAQVAAIAPCVREVVHLQRGPDDDVRFAPLRALHRVRVGLVGAAGDKPWAPGTLRLRLPPRHASAREDARYAAAVARVGRAITGRRVGVALGGGGAWGYAHVGLLDRLERRGVPVDVVAGCSFGAVVGAYFAARDDGLDAVKRAGPRLSRAVHWAILSSESVSRTLDPEFDAQRIEALERPFFPVATDIASGAQRTVRIGKLSDGVRASGAFPGMFTPVTYDGARLVDGGIINNVPEDVPAREGAHLVIASNIVSAPSREPASKPRLPGRRGRQLHEFNPIARARDLVRSMLVLMHTAGAGDAYLADVTFTPPVPPVAPWDFSKPDVVIQHAREALDETLEVIAGRWAQLARPRVPGVASDLDPDDEA